MAEDLAKKGNAAFVDEEYAGAVELYTQAIELEPSNAGFYCSRAHAHLRLENFTDAVADANRAIELDSSLSKAYLRKGLACFSLEEYHTALEAFKAGSALDPDNSSFKNYISKCEARISDENSLDSKETDTLPSAASNGLQQLTSGNGLETSTPSSDQVPSLPSTADLQQAKPKYRHEYYQSSQEVVVTVFAKGACKDNVSVEFGEQFLSIIIKVPEEDSYVLQKRLFAKVVPSRCKFIIMSTKIEIRLAKADLIQWTSLEYVKDQAVLQKPNASSDMPRPKYPSSNKKSTRDWDKLEAQVKKEEKEEKLDGDAALNKLFRDIYQDADEDTRRAMSKSFIESNGTVLSTNWKEVGSKTVEGSPPEGMEMRKWEV